MSFLYNFLIRVYGLGIHLAALFSKKAALWVTGRRGWRASMAKALARPAEKTLWIHAASVGEFEQGRPVIEAYRKENPKHRIVLSFFSPSGYELRKDYAVADAVVYLPLDTTSNARDFIEIVNPDIAIFIKYEFWFNHLKELKQRKVNTFLVSGRMHEGQSFFKSWGAYFRKGLSAFTHFSVQNEQSESLLKSIGFQNVSMAGDTRFDRVCQVVEENRILPIIESFVSGRRCLVLGSSWPYDELLLESFIKSHREKGFAYIIAPHEIDEKRMQEMEQKLRASEVKTARISSLGNEGGPIDLLFVDNVGMLSSIYKYADVAMVGGGFGNGIHNVLEPAAWGKPVLFGPRHSMFQEARELVESGAAMCVEEQVDFDEQLLRLLENKSQSQELGHIAGEYCKQRAGATAKVMKLINEKSSFAIVDQ